MTTQLSSSLLKELSSDIKIFAYDRQAVRQGILHIGVGGFHRSHEALYLEELMSEHGATEWAICGVGIMPQDEHMNNSFQAQNGLYTLLERSEVNGQLLSSARVVGALTEYIWGYKYPEQVFAKMADPAIRIVSLTATENGYYLDEATGGLLLTHPNIQHDLNHPEQPRTIFGYLAKGLEERRKNQQVPFTVLSCDNIQGNGHVLQRLLIAFCKQKDAGLAEWVEANVAFPNSMVDRITPATTAHERQLVEKTCGYRDDCPVVSERFKQWVIEDHFPAGRPALEKVGVQFTESVAAYERMKIRLLNATHSAMGYLGYLCGHRMIHEIAQDAEFSPYLKRLMDEEVSPLIGVVPGVDLEVYKQTVRERFSNTLIQDQALRICMDGSGKMPKYIFPSLNEQLACGGPIRLLTLCVVSWMRFLNGVDESGAEIPIIDPLGERLKQLAQQGQSDPKVLLSQRDIFGNLIESERFVKEAELLLAKLYQEGAKKTLAFCLSH